MEIIIHNQCPLTLSAGLWINTVLMAEEKPAIPISQQLRPAQEERERRWQWVGVIELRRWMSLCSLPRGPHFQNTLPGCLLKGLLLLTSAPHSLFAHCNGKGSPVPAGKFPHGRCLVQFGLIKLQLLTQGQAGPPAQREAMQKDQG